MGDKTGIEWTDATWNPVVGCSKVSPGCDNCYAIGASARNAARLAHTSQRAYDDLVVDDDWSGVVRCLPERLGWPASKRTPKRIFVNSMSDLFHPDVPLEFILDVWSVMANAPQHQFQVLTKRPQRMRKIVNSICWDGGTAGEPWSAYVAPGRWEDPETGEVWEPTEGDLESPNGNSGELPLPNVWLGTSIESNQYAWRAYHLRETKAAVRFISAEPLVGPLHLLDLSGIDWLIVGGESGKGARPMHPDWVRDLRDRSTTWLCEDCGKSWVRRGAALSPTPDDECLHCGGGLMSTAWERGPAFLFKQTGSVLAREWGLKSKKGTDMDEWPSEFKVREYPDA